MHVPDLVASQLLLLHCNAWDSMQEMLSQRSQSMDRTCMQAMGKIHAIRRDGGIVTNVEAFKQLYEAAGRGWVYSFARIGPLKSAAEWCGLI